MITLQTKTDEIKAKRFSTKHKATYEISHADRQMMVGAWKFSRTEGHPFNTHLTFSFKIDPAAPEDDIKTVRAAAHQLRMWFQHKKIPSHILWTRFVAAGSDTEDVDLLVHVPEQHFAGFKKNVEKWDFGIKIEPATYEADRFFAGKHCNIMEIMLKATSAETRSKEPDAPYRASAAMKGRRCFSSIKLGIPARRKHRAAAASKTLDGINFVHNISDDKQ